MKHARSIGIVLVAGLVPVADVQACTPVPPLTLFWLGGAPLLSMYSLFAYGTGAMLLVVALKSTIFASRQRVYSRPHAFMRMCVANAYSTIPGVLLIMMMAAPVLAMLALPLLLVCARYSGGVLQRVESRRLGLSANAWTSLIFAGAVTTAGLLEMSQHYLYGNVSFSPVFYWAFKITSAILSVVIGLMVTTGFELSILAARVEDRDQAEQLSDACIAANVATLLVLAAIGAALAIPRRLASRRMGLI